MLFVLSAPSVMQDISLSQIGLQQIIFRTGPESPDSFFLNLAHSFPGKMILGSDFFERQFRSPDAIEGSNDFLVFVRQRAEQSFYFCSQRLCQQLIVGRFILIGHQVEHAAFFIIRKRSIHAQVAAC